MNKEQKKQGEKIASNLLRVLAIVGFVAIIALAAWLFAQALGSMPNIKENLRAAVNSMSSILQEAPEESITFNSDTSTLGTNEATTIRWSYEGENKPSSYSLSYTCESNVKLSMFLDSGWTDVDCAEPVTLENQNVTVIPTNESSRFANVTFTVKANNMQDSIVVSVVNTDISETFTSKNDEDEGTDDAEDGKDEKTESTSENSASTNTATNQQQASSLAQPTQQRVVERRVPRYYGDADLVIEIEETGVLVDVKGEDTFFPVSPIPDNKVAGVVFTVTNKGGETSEPWRFTAELPVEGDDDYEYTSPLQIPLASGMQITFTLGFDEILEEDDGRIRIELDPNDSRDDDSNNTDSTTIKISD